MSELPEHIIQQIDEVQAMIKAAMDSGDRGSTRDIAEALMNLGKAVSGFASAVSELEDSIRLAVSDE